MAPRFAILTAVSVLALAGLFFALRPDRPAAAPTERAFDVRVTGSGMDPENLSAREDDRVVLSVAASRPTKLHVHGYDLEREVAPGSETTLSFRADQTGRFPIEDHGSGTGLGVFFVEPR